MYVLGALPRAQRPRPRHDESLSLSGASTQQRARSDLTSHDIESCEDSAGVRFTSPFVTMSCAGGAAPAPPHPGPLKRLIMIKGDLGQMMLIEDAPPPPPSSPWHPPSDLQFPTSNTLANLVAVASATVGRTVTATSTATDAAIAVCPFFACSLPLPAVLLPMPPAAECSSCWISGEASRAKFKL